MALHNDSEHEIEALRERLLRLSEASLRVGGSLDLDAVLSEAVDGARAITGARYGGLTLSDESGGLQTFVTSGVTPEEREALLKLSGGDALFDFLSNVQEPMRLADFPGDAIKELPGVASDELPDVKTFLGAPIRNGDVRIGNFYLAEKEGGREFSDSDEETLALFASHAAAAIINARRYHDERRARARLEALIDTSPVGVVVLDAKTASIESFNREVMRIVNVLQDAGQSLGQFIETVTIQRAGQDMSVGELLNLQPLSGGDTVHAEEIVFRVADGRSVTTLMNAKPILSEEGEVQSFVVTLQDMTPVEDLERLRAEFLGMVSHELRAPLTSIKGSAATLISSGQSLDPAETLQFHRIIDDQAEHMRELITDLLDAARIETGSLSVTPSPYDAVMLVDQARNAFLSAGGRNNLALDMELGLPQVMVERRRIAQVLNNLLSNAASHSPESSTIRIGAVRDGVHVAFFVEDEGRGISRENIPHLFRKHSRAYDDDRGGITGSGLGLAICKGIVEAHGGRIWAESKGIGMGARFTFTLPAVLDTGFATTSIPGRASEPPARASRNQTRILVVDDDPRTLRYVRDALTDANFFPIVTADPLDVQRLVKEERPHLVLLDMMLPGMDGLELMQSIPELANAPVIFISAYGRDQVVAQALEAGAADYVVKPFSPTELVARIRSALRRQISPQLTEPTDSFVLGDLTINYAERTVIVAGRSVRLTNTEYRLLSELSRNAGRVCTHSHLLQRVWGMGHPGHPGPVRTVIKNLRHKLQDRATNPLYIFSESRVGYRMPKGETQRVD